MDAERITTALTSTTEALSRRIRRLETLEQPPSAAPAGDTYVMSRIIAAVDSSASDKASAHVVCDGTDDEIEIQAALDTYKHVYLKAGTYTLNDSIYVPTIFSLVGAGSDTVLEQGSWSAISYNVSTIHGVLKDFKILGNASANSPCIDAYPDDTDGYLRIENVIIDGNSVSDMGILSYGYHIDIINCDIYNTDDAGVQIYVQKYNVERCRVHNCGNYGLWLYAELAGSACHNICYSNVNAGLNTEGWDAPVDVIGNICYNNTTDGIQLATCQWMTCIGNVCYGNTQSGINLSSLQHSTVVGNECFNNGDYGIESSFSTWITIASNSIHENTKSGIFISQSDLMNITGNICDQNTLSGIHCYSSNAIINGNICVQNGQHGIIIQTCSDTSVVGNNVYDNSQTTNNTYDGILLTGNVLRACVQCNKVRGDAVGNKHRYGINIAAAGDTDNLVTNNDLLGSSVSGSLNDAGTGTITAAGNRV